MYYNIELLSDVYVKIKFPPGFSSFNYTCTKLAGHGPDC